MRITRSSLAVALLAGGLMVATGCGDDEPNIQRGPPKKSGGGKPAAQQKKKGKKSKAGVLEVYNKIPEDLRRPFIDRDFVPDPNGEENRNPFRSYIIAQPGAAGSAGGVSLEPTDLCTLDNTYALNYSLRDLRLIGIVLRGTRSYAQFRDTAGFGHIVRRGDCLGKEKAVVQVIGTGFVSLEVTPEAPPGAPAPAPQKRDIALYPEEYQLNDMDEGRGGEEE